MGAMALPQVAGGASTTQRKTCIRALRRQASRHPKYATTVPPVALTSILGVLQRPATPADELPAEALAGISPDSYSTIWLRSARLLDTTPDNRRYFLVPGVYVPPILPEACVKREPLHVRRLLRKVGQLSPRGPVVTLERYSSHETGGIPFTASMIQAGKATGIDLGESGPTTAFYGLVPNGVASIVVTAGGAPPATVLAVNNFFLVQIPALRANRPYSIVQQWYATDGTLIKAVSIKIALYEFSVPLAREPA
jgi:hypothetical protein